MGCSLSTVDKPNPPPTHSLHPERSALIYTPTYVLSFSRSLTVEKSKRQPEKESSKEDPGEVSIRISTTSTAVSRQTRTFNSLFCLAQHVAQDSYDGSHIGLMDDVVGTLGWMRDSCYDCFPIELGSELTNRLFCFLSSCLPAISIWTISAGPSRYFESDSCPPTPTNERQTHDETPTDKWVDSRSIRL